MDPERTFALRMRHLREANGWSQAELARRISEVSGSSVHSSTITRWERNAEPSAAGGRGIRLRDAAYIARVFAVDLDEMIYPESAAIREARDAVRKYREAEERRNQAREEADKAAREWNQWRARLVSIRDQLAALGVTDGLDQEGGQRFPKGPGSTTCSTTT